MKQLIQDIRSGETSVVDVPVPTPPPGMVLVRTAASVVSVGTERTLVEFAGKSLIGKARSRPDLVRQTLDKARREGILTTLEAVQNRLDQPMPLGYASAGAVAEVGPGTTGFRVGDRVACAGAGYAVHGEYAVVPMNLLARLPDTVDFESGAFATLGAIALHGFRLGEPQVGESVAVIGLGVVGLLAVGVAQAAGCRVFAIDIDPARVARARRMGAHAVVRAEAEPAAASFTQGQGFDLVLICAHTAGSDPVELAAAIARDRGRVVATGLVGLDLPRKPFYDKELQFVVSRSYGPGRYDPDYEEGGHDYPLGYVRWTEARNLAAFVGLLAEGKIDVHSLITHRFPIERAAEAYRLISGEVGQPFLAVVITYPEAQAAAPAVERKVAISSRPPSPTSLVRLGVVGAGSFATGVLLPALRKMAAIELVGLASATGIKAQAVARRFGFRFAATDEAQVLGDPSINTIAIVTRHGLHARQTLAALQAGKHVFCEKPLALTRPDLEALLQAVTSSDRLLMVGFNRRFAPMAVRMKQFLESSGEPMAMHYRVNAGPLPPNHWVYDPEQGGGRILGEVCHFIDFLTFLTGSLPVRVQALGLPDSGRYQEENVLVSLEFADGSLGSVAYLANGDRSFPKERVEAFAAGRVAVLDDFRRLDLIADGRRRTWRSYLRQDKGHRAEWESFVRAVACGGPPPIPYSQLFSVSLAALGALESLRTRQPIRIEPLTLGG
ncbi:MAG: bi-domain-containing oxidoreductase [Chloroflexota bacterium]